MRRRAIFAEARRISHRYRPIVRDPSEPPAPRICGAECTPSEASEDATLYSIFSILPMLRGVFTAYEPGVGPNSPRQSGKPHVSKSDHPDR
jgi:hypothetical protein